MADTAALVVALSAQLTKFEKDMQKAGIMAERAVGDIEGKFAKMNPQVNASFLGNMFSTAVTQGINAATQALTTFYERFKDLDKQAQITGLSMEQLWGFQEAMKSFGASTEDAAKFASELNRMLAEMQRGDVNNLSKLFDVNPNALQGIKRDTMTLQQAWQVVAQLVRDTEGGANKIEVGRLAGASQDMALALDKAGASLAGMERSATAAAPPLNQMAEAAKRFDGYMETAANWVKADLAQGVENTRREFEAIYNIWRQITGQPMRLIMPLGGPKEPEAKGAGTTNIPLKTTGAAKQTDEFQRANDQITKNIALLDAQTKTMFMNVGAQAAARAEAQLMEAERRRLNLAEGEAVPISEELRKKIDAQAAAMSRATLENAKAAQHLQRINEAYDTFGSAVSTAFADAIIEGKKLNEVLSSLLKTLARAAINSTITGVFNALKPGAFAGGTDYAPGGMALVGERGPELVNLPRGSQVIPNDVLRGGMSGGGSITYAPAIDARGASVEAVARLAQIIEQDRAMFASRTVATIQQARRGRVPGV
jgi:hypothetical protein